MPPHPLNNFEIQKYQNEPRFNGVYSRDNLQKIKDGAYIINLDDSLAYIINQWVPISLILELIGLLWRTKQLYYLPWFFRSRTYSKRD